MGWWAWLRLASGGTRRRESFQANLAFESRDILRGLIRDAGNQVTVGDQMARSHVPKRASACAEQTLARLFRFMRVLDELHDLPLCQAADLVQMPAVPSVPLFGVRKAEGHST